MHNKQREKKVHEAIETLNKLQTNVEMRIYDEERESSAKSIICGYFDDIPHLIKSTVISILPLIDDGFHEVLFSFVSNSLNLWMDGVSFEDIDLFEIVWAVASSVDHDRIVFLVLNSILEVLRRMDTVISRNVSVLDCIKEFSSPDSAFKLSHFLFLKLLKKLMEKNGFKNLQYPVIEKLKKEILEISSSDSFSAIFPLYTESLFEILKY